jgi:hypothetical protein
MKKQKKRAPPVLLRPFRYTDKDLRQIAGATKLELPTTPPGPAKWPERRPSDQWPRDVILGTNWDRVEQLRYQLWAAANNWQLAYQEEVHSHNRADAAWHEYMCRLADIFENIYERKATAHTTLKKRSYVVDTPFVRFASAAVAPLGKITGPTGPALRKILQTRTNRAAGPIRAILVS